MARSVDEKSGGRTASRMAAGYMGAVADERERGVAVESQGVETDWQRTGLLRHRCIAFRDEGEGASRHRARLVGMSVEVARYHPILFVRVGLSFCKQL